MLESMPVGWVLDDTHQRHITTLQRYVPTADLDRVYPAVETTIGDADRHRRQRQRTGRAEGLAALSEARR